jgi:beta-N-acetylhexosaminidase
MKSPGLLAMLVVAAVLTGAAPAASGPATPQLVGQLLLVRMQGTTPSPAFLQRVRLGRIGGVVLFSDDLGPDARRAVATLQAAALAAGQPPLLIAVDQEGGIVKRLPGPPTLAPPQMTTPTLARSQGAATARSLRLVGINVDLAPVLDVGYGGFITPRTFGSTPGAVAARGIAFADGLASGGVGATAKHFPGLGRATVNTDDASVVVHATAAQLRSDWLPFRAAASHGIGAVMVSTAIYPALGSRLPAAFAPGIVRDLRREVGFRGVIVTDALRTPAVERLYSTPEAAVRAVAAGDDLVLAAGPTDAYADTDGASTASFSALVAAVGSGRIPLARVRAAYERVLALKAAVG